MRPWVAPGMAFILGLALFLGGQTILVPEARKGTPFEAGVEVVLPVPGALALSLGDSHLAANMGIMRALVAANHMDTPQERAMFARLMENGLTLAPAHEDGYYLAQATLPWWGYVDLNQQLLDQASKARPWDWLPPFFQAFNRFYFRKAPEEAASFMREAAERAPPRTRQGLLATAGRWVALGDRPEEALKTIQTMVEATRKGPLRRNLALRARQLKGLMALRRAAEAFQKTKGHPPEALEQLIGFGDLQSIPTDPLQDGYVISDEGKVVIKPPRALTHKLKVP